MHSRTTFLAQIEALKLHSDAEDFAAYVSQEKGPAERVLLNEPGLQLYTLCSWGDEVWAHRGLRPINCLGYLVGRVDLGVGFKELLWTEPLDAL